MHVSMEEHTFVTVNGLRVKIKMSCHIISYIQCMNLRDERHRLTQRLCTGYLDEHVVPQNCTSITKAFLAIF